MEKKIGFASDYDNTLFMHKKWKLGISKKDQNGVRSFVEAGGIFGLCTGRPYDGFFMDPVIHKLPVSFYIASTGAHIVDKDGNVLFEKTVPIPLATEVFAFCGEVIEQSAQFDGRQYAIKRSPYKFTPVIDSLDEMNGHKLYEFSLRLKDETEAAALTGRINATYGDDITAYQNVQDIDIVAAGCSKGTGALFIKEHYHLSFLGGMGDSLNDVPLVQAADMGFTFKKAPDALTDAADRTVLNVAEALSIILSEA